MANEKIGTVRCPWCASDRASVTVTKSGLCAVTCNACHCQTFARSDYSDTKIRQAMTPLPKEAAPPPAPPATASPIVVDPPVISAPAPKAPPESKPVEQTKKSTWDIF